MAVEEPAVDGSLHDEPFEIASPDGTIDGVLCRPAAAGRQWPAVLYLTDIGGIRPAELDKARRLAAEGYVVCVPNAFYRTRRPPLFDFPRNMKEERSQKRFAELAAPLTPDAMARDADVYVNWLAARADVAPGPMGVVGYCFTGGFALRVAAARPDRIVAAASFHGGNLATDTAASPRHLLPHVRARLYFGHAVEDRSMPPDAIERLERALAAWGGRYESETYAGAFHGWTAPDSPVFNPVEADRAFAKLTALLRETLGS